MKYNNLSRGKRSQNLWFEYLRLHLSNKKIEVLDTNDGMS